MTKRLEWSPTRDHRVARVNRMLTKRASGGSMAPKKRRASYQLHYQRDYDATRLVRWGHSRVRPLVTLDHPLVETLAADHATPLAWLLAWETVKERGGEYA